MRSLSRAGPLLLLLAVVALPVALFSSHVPGAPAAVELVSTPAVDTGPLALGFVTIERAPMSVQLDVLTDAQILVEPAARSSAIAVDQRTPGSVAAFARTATTIDLERPSTISRLVTASPASPDAQTHRWRAAPQLGYTTASFPGAG